MSVRTLLASVAVTSLLTACAPASSPTAPPVPSATADKEVAEKMVGNIRQSDVAALDEALQGGNIVLVDVRTPGEFSAGHVPGAQNIPLDQVPNRIEDFRAFGDRELWLVCRSGARSNRAASILADAGISAVNVAGGTMAWQAAGKPVE